MTFTIPLKLKLALIAALATCFVVTAPAGAIVKPIQCGVITVKGKKWQIVADQVRCSTAKKWSATYIRSYKTPRYYKCVRATSFWRVCEAKRYDPTRTFFIKKRS